MHKKLIESYKNICQIFSFYTILSYQQYKLQLQLIAVKYYNAFQSVIITDANDMPTGSGSALVRSMSSLLIDQSHAIIAPSQLTNKYTMVID